MWVAENRRGSATTPSGSDGEPAIRDFPGDRRCRLRHFPNAEVLFDRSGSERFVSLCRPSCEFVWNSPAIKAKKPPGKAGRFSIH
jgi:hypothetical protein